MSLVINTDTHMSRTTLPPYLTSGASSRAHHALLVKLNAAQSGQEEDVIIREEMVRARETLAAAGTSQVSLVTRSLKRRTGWTS
jgi:hypothetical protein